MLAQEVFLLGTNWEALVLGLFSQPLFRIACFSLYISLYSLSYVHVYVRLSRTDTCPISPYPKWLGVVVKTEEYGSVRYRVFNGSNGSFPFVLGHHTVQRSFLYQRRYFRSFQNCSYTVLAPFFQGDLGYAENRIVLSYVSELLGLLLHVLGYTPRSEEHTSELQSL